MKKISLLLSLFSFSLLGQTETYVQSMAAKYGFPVPKIINTEFPLMMGGEQMDKQEFFKKADDFKRIDMNHARTGNSSLNLSAKKNLAWLGSEYVPITGNKHVEIELNAMFEKNSKKSWGNIFKKGVAGAALIAINNAVQKNTKQGTEEVVQGAKINNNWITAATGASMIPEIAKLLKGVPKSYANLYFYDKKKELKVTVRMPITKNAKNAWENLKFSTTLYYDCFMRMEIVNESKESVWFDDVSIKTFDYEKVEMSQEQKDKLMILAKETDKIQNSKSARIANDYIPKDHPMYDTYIGGWADLICSQPSDVSKWSLFVRNILDGINTSPFTNLSERIYGFQPISENSPGYSYFSGTTIGYGELNIDQYAVSIPQLPTNMASMNDLFTHFRLNINSFIDTDKSKFTPYSLKYPNYQSSQYYNNNGIGDNDLWNSSNPQGTAMSIFINEAENAGVICNHYWNNNQTAGWIFTTISSPGDGAHPLNGNRAFGATNNENNVPGFSRYAISTKAADRWHNFWYWLANQLSNGVPASQQRALWQSMQQRVCQYVNQNGGECYIDTPYAMSLEWDSVRMQCN